MTKFMQTMDPRFFRRLTRAAERRGISVQELLRAIIIPDWLSTYRSRERRKTKRR
jgi:hypothetical protein